MTKFKVKLQMFLSNEFQNFGPVDPDLCYNIKLDLKFYLRQVSGIKYLNQMSTYHLAWGDSEIKQVG